MIRFRSIGILTTLLLILLTSCKSGEEKPLVAVGGPVYGGEFRFMSTEKVNSLLPASIRDVYSYRVASQLFENLLRINPETLEVEPLLAEKWEVSDDGKKYTFYIRTGVYFHDNVCFSGETGKEMTADDVKFALEFACSGLEENEASSLLLPHIKGAKRFNKETKKKLGNHSVAGIKVVNSRMLEIELYEPFVNFTKILTHPSLAIFPKEAFDHYRKSLKKNPVGTGPFSLKTWNNEQIELVRNTRYWRTDKHGNKLPFLDKVTMTYAKNKREELMSFRQQKIDLVLDIPADETDHVLGSLEDAQAGLNVKHKLDAKSSFSLNYFAFRLDQPPFDQLAVRKAFLHAIDRDKLVNDFMKGEGYPMNHGFVPEMNGYVSSQVKGYAFDLVKAQQFLAEAGYKNGQNFPKMDVYVAAKEESMTHLLAQGVVKQLNENLNLQLTIKLCSYEEHKKALRSGKALFWRNGWIADYPDPENFLDLFYGENVLNDGSKTNSIRFNNPTFNSLFEASWKEKDEAKRMEILLKCDQLIMDEALVIPVTNDDFFTMIHSKFKDFSSSPMEGIDFSCIFIKEPKKERF